MTITSSVAQCLTQHQQQVAARAIAEESARREHVIVSLSGAHAYGFPSPDSDLDVKAVHLESTAALLGFPRTPSGAERLEVIDGVEVDYSSNELGGVLQGVLKGNGNYLERFLSGYEFSTSPMVSSLRPLVQASLSRKLARHYQGFALGLLREWEGTGCRSAKKLLYVLRTTLTGTHALLEGAIVTDVNQLLARYGFNDASELIEQKRRGEKSELSPELSARWKARIPAALALLAEAEASSPLPEVAPNAEQLEAWLIEQRLQTLRGPANAG